MNVYTLYKEAEDDTKEEKKEVKESNEAWDIVDYLKTQPGNEIWLYTVTTWFTGHNGDWPEDAWQIDDQSRANEWLEDWTNYG